MPVPDTETASVANVQFQFGFQPYGEAAGSAPTFGLRQRLLAYNYGTALFRGDPVQTTTDGTVILASSQSNPLAGIFWGCEYPNSNLKGLPQKSLYWPGVSLGASLSTAVVTAWVIDDPNQLFLAAELGTSTNAISKANVGNNVQYVAGAGGNTATGISTYCIDDNNIANTATLPFKIMDLYSTFAPPGQNGADDTTVYNWAVVKMNYSERAAGTYGH